MVFKEKDILPDPYFNSLFKKYEHSKQKMKSQLGYHDSYLSNTFAPTCGVRTQLNAWFSYSKKSQAQKKFQLDMKKYQRMIENGNTRNLKNFTGYRGDICENICSAFKRKT